MVARRRSGGMDTHPAFVLRIVFGLALVLAVVACGSGPSKPSPSVPAVPGMLTGTAWSVRSIDGRAMAPIHPPTVIFEATRVVGSGGCNGYGGDYAFASETGTLTMGDLASTLILCAGPEGDDEGRFFKAFRGPLAASIAGDQLTLAGANGVIVLEAAVRDNSGG